MSLVVNGVAVASMRWLAPWSGVWSAELELAGDVVPSGRVAIIGTEGIALAGTVDDTLSGTFGEKRFVRVIGGANGWSKVVRPQHYHSDIGLRLDEIVATTAAAAGELATVLVPKLVGIDFVRSDQAAASQVFVDAGVDWWVGVDGVTRVGTRLPLVAPASLVVLDWQPAAGTVSFTADVLVEPGTVLVDERFGRKLVREVEALVENASVKGTLWVVDAAPEPGTVTELATHLASLARSAIRPEFLRLYEYRVIAMAGDRVELQAVNADDGAPDIVPASVWAGASGYRATLRPGSLVLVGFRAGDPRRPYVAAYEPPEGGGWRPLELELDALATVAIGAEAVAIVLGVAASGEPVARSPAVIAFASALKTAINTAASAATLSGAVPVTGATLGTLLGGIVTAMTTAITALTTNCPSKKVVTS